MKNHLTIAHRCLVLAFGIFVINTTLQAEEERLLFSNIPDDCCEGKFVGNMTNIWGSNSKGILAQPFLTGPSGSLSIRMPMAREGWPGGTFVFEIWDDKGGKPNQMVTVAAEIDIDSLAPAPNGEIVTFKKAITDLSPNTPYHLVVKSNDAVFSNSGKTVRLLITSSGVDTYGSGKMLDGNFGNGWRPMPPFASFLRMEMTEVDVVSNDLIVATSEDATVTISPDMEKYPAGTEITVTAEPKEGFEFVKWTYDGDEFTTNPATIIIKEGATLTPVFVQSEETILLYNNIPKDCCDGSFVGLFPAGNVLGGASSNQAQLSQRFKTGQSGFVTIQIPMARTGSPRGTAQFEIWSDVDRAPGTKRGTIGEVDIASLPAGPNGEMITLDDTIPKLAPNTTYHLVGKFSSDSVFGADSSPSFLISDTYEGADRPEPFLAFDGSGWVSLGPLMGTGSVYLQMDVIEVETVSNDLIVATTDDGAITAIPDLENYPVGSEVSVTAEPMEGFEFVKWIYGDEEFTSNPASITLKAGATLTPVFAKQEAEAISIDIAPAMAIGWDSQTGKTYDILSSTDLENWIVEVEGVEGNGETSTYFFIRSTSEIYYRVEETP